MNRYRSKLSMSAIPFALNNAEYAKTFDKGDLPLPPGKHVIVVTCMDARLDPYSHLGLNLGEAHVIRNAGGSVEDALRSIIISQRLLGTKEIAIFKHIGCGMLTFNTPQLRDIVKKATPGEEAATAVDKIHFHEFGNLEEAVKKDIELLKSNPLVLEGTRLSGWIYHVETGKISPVV